MFEEGQLYSPVSEHADGSVTVHLAPCHPGANDPEYLRRRGEIARAALDW
jgi:phenylalanine-4-hydroxylase